MYNETNSVKDLTEAYESLKEVVMEEASWDAMKEMSPVRAPDHDDLYEARGCVNAADRRAG